MHYIKSFNATQSYLKAYGCDYTTALVNGPRLLGNARVKDEIMKLKKQRYSQALLRPEDIFQRYMDIAFNDITNYAIFGKEERIVGFNDDGVPVQNKVNFVDFKSSNEVNGSLISEIKVGKNGASIKLLDSMKALEWLANHMNMATEEQKAKLKLLNAQVAKATGEGLEIEDTSDVDGEIYGDS